MEVISCEVPPQSLYSAADVHRIRSKELLNVQVGLMLNPQFLEIIEPLKRCISNHWIISVLHDVHYENEYS